MPRDSSTPSSDSTSDVCVLRQGNQDTYIYPVLKLPAEIIAEIFIHFLPPYPQRAPTTGLRSPVILGQICGRWRAIALSTPPLWRSVGVSLPWTGIAKMDRALPVLKTWLSRSGSCPLSIALECRGAFHLLPLIDAIMLHRARLEHLKLFSTFDQLRVIDQPLPSLRSLTLTMTLRAGKVPPIPFVFVAPLLRRVAVFRYDDVYRLMFPWIQLTALIVDGIALHACDTVLNLAPNLLYCRFRINLHMEDYEDDEDDSPTPVRPLSYLNTLVLRTESPTDSFVDFLRTLRLPALRSLQVAEAFLGPDPVAGLRDLISTSACTLLKMHILDPRQSENPCEPYEQEWPTVFFSCGPQGESKPMFFRTRDGQYQDGDEYDFGDNEAFMEGC